LEKSKNPACVIQNLETIKAILNQCMAVDARNLMRRLLEVP